MPATRPDDTAAESQAAESQAADQEQRSENTDPTATSSGHLWAVLPETLATITEMLRNGIAGKEVREHAFKQAATSSREAGSQVAVLSLSGLITPQPSFLSFLFGGSPGGLLGFREDFANAVRDPNVSAILIDIDSPGGLVDLVPETAAEIRGARGTKPIVAVADTLAASAAYWIASQADEVVVTPSGEAGSIGVFIAHRDISEAMAAMGVKTTLISAGRYKTEGNPYEPLSDEARAALQERVDDAYALFVGDVAAGRGTSEHAVREGYGEGRVLTAQRAVDVGLADKVATFEETLAGLANSATASASSAAGPLAAAADTEPAQPDLPSADTPPADEPARDLTADERRRLADVLLA